MHIFIHLLNLKDDQIPLNYIYEQRLQQNTSFLKVFKQVKLQNLFQIVENDKKYYLYFL